MDRKMCKGKALAAKFPISQYVVSQQTLLTEKIMNREKKYFIQREKVYFPLKTQPNSHQRELIHRRQGEVVTVDTRKFPRKRKPSLGLQELDKKHSCALPKSITVVGNIILINQLPKGQEKNKERIGRILKKNFAARGVFLKEKELKGKKRVAEWSKLAGWGEPVAICKEAGFYYFVKFSQVFFNPRMSSERNRVISQVQKNETVLDMFAGVGPFSIPIGKRQTNVYAIDINAEAIHLLTINKKLNRVNHNVKPILGDAKKQVHKLETKVDRIIMNYPKNSFSFIDEALNVLKHKGVIHLYTFAWGTRREDAIHEIKTRMKKFIANESNYILSKLQNNVVLAAAPSKYLVASDAYLEKNSVPC